MSLPNPLTTGYVEADDTQLVRVAVDGDRVALDALIRRHQPFIYNVAWKMVHDPNDALDLTQEVLLKVITKLGQFNFKSSFRTWLYRIVTNEFLMGKRRKGEELFSTFAEHSAALHALPSTEPTREEAIEQAELSEEMKVRCLSAMLMCLSREQRLIYILGDSFGIDHKLGAEVFGISPANFRVKLHRARKDLYSYMNNQCGLVNPANPCRCPKKARTLIDQGALDKSKMQFNVGYRRKIADFAVANYQDLDDAFDEAYTKLFRDHPARQDFDKQTVIDRVLDNEELMGYFDDTAE